MVPPMYNTSTFDVGYCGCSSSRPSADDDNGDELAMEPFMGVEEADAAMPRTGRSDHVIIIA